MKDIMRFLSAIFFISSSSIISANQVDVTHPTKEKKANNQIRRRRVTEKVLPTSNVCWVHDNGKICLQQGSLRSITLMEDAAMIQDFIGNSIYDYNMVDTDYLRLELFSEMQSRSVPYAVNIDSSWMDPLDSIKYNCHVETTSNYVNLTDPSLVKVYEDQSSMWNMSGWIIHANAEMIPLSISTDSNEPFLYFNGIEEFEESIKGCNPNTDEENESPNYNELSKENEAKMLAYAAFDGHFTEAGYHTTGTLIEDYAGASGGLMDLSTYIQALVTNTQWCGSGTDKQNTACPSSSKSFDYQADRACRRHDHAKKWEAFSVGITKVARSECNVDKELVDASGDNWAVKAIFGSWGLAQTWGCFEEAKYDCWKGIMYGNYCEGTVVRYGPNRYKNRNWEWGYVEPYQNCANDLPFTYFNNP